MSWIVLIVSTAIGLLWTIVALQARAERTERDASIDAHARRARRR